MTALYVVWCKLWTTLTAVAAFMRMRWRRARLFKGGWVKPAAAMQFVMLDSTRAMAGRCHGNAIEAIRALRRARRMNRSVNALSAVNKALVPMTAAISQVEKEAVARLGQQRRASARGRHRAMCADEARQLDVASDMTNVVTYYRLLLDRVTAAESRALGVNESLMAEATVATERYLAAHY